MLSSDSMAEWLNIVAHDLKTPIGSVRSCIDLVEQLGELNEKQEQFLQRAMAGLDRMEHLVSRLLDISWIDANMQLDLKPCNLPPLIQEIADFHSDVARTRQIAFQFYFADDLEPIIADVRRLGQVFDNLVSNAVKYNKDGGVVRIDVTNEQDSVLVKVQDTGMGIAAEDQGRVFERFFRSRAGVRQKIEGSGLGLAIVQAIIQKHQGRIWLESKPGAGTTFFFTLPLEMALSEGNDTTSEARVYAGEGNEGQVSRQAHLATEENDAVNDDIQEPPEDAPMDVSSDEI
ncbi:MAG: HAMP domain-containing histidine kinase [Anaerolineaceae bacterium]|nr:HAMP domain-containing histidine kinase [Anaerolineaceae bacterium]